MVPPCNNGEESSQQQQQSQSPPPPPPSPQLTIAYGSETGVAQDAALTLYNFARSHGISCHFGSLDDVGIVAMETAANTEAQHRQQLLIAACSTTGQGDPPANMKRFWRLAMSRRMTQGCLAGPGGSAGHHGNAADAAAARLRFCLIGFGDSSYLQYNFVAKKLHRRLSLLGARPDAPLALANDQDDQGPDQAFLPFAERISALLTDTYSVRCACVGSCLDAPLTPLYRVVTLTAARPVRLPNYRLPQSGDLTDFQLARIVANRRMTAEDHFQDTRLLTLSPTGDNSQLWRPFEPGDVLQVLPSNSDATVNSLLTTLSHLDPDTRLVLSQADPNFPTPKDLPADGATLRWLLTHYFDISCVPRRSFFETLRRIAMGIGDGESDADLKVKAATDSERLEMEIDRLGEFVRDVDELLAYCNRPRRTVAETLRDFPISASRISLSRLFDLLRPIQPRSFSIASLGRAGCRELDLLVAVVRYKSSLMSEPRLGLCSNYLACAQPGSLLSVRLQRGTLRVPPNQVPVILVGPGTGIAPFRGLVQLRHGSVCNGDGEGENRQAEGEGENRQAEGEGENRQAEGEGDNNESAETLVFFGCRHAEKDFYFKSEWLEWMRASRNRFKLVPAHSRPTGVGEHGCYVQARIREHGPQVARMLLQNGGAVIVAGSSGAMPRDVLAAVQAALTEHGGCDDVTAAGLLAEWQRTGRYQMETWS